MKEELSDRAPLQDMENRLRQFESKFNSIIERAKENEARRQADFQAERDVLRNEIKGQLNGIKQEIINSALSTKPVKPISHPPTTAFDGTVNLDEYEKFAKHPYFMYPGGRNTVYVVVPKFYPAFQTGWLVDEVDGVWNRYEVNQYAILFGSVPEQILKHINMPEPIRATVEGDMISFAPDVKKDVRRQLTRYVRDWKEGSARITRGNEYNIIDQILQSGHIPFVPKPVKDEHVVGGDGAIKLRDYQKPVWDNFLKHGAVGVFHPTGSGKSFVGMMALEKIKVKGRRNLIISPKRTLVSQWREYMESHIPQALKHTMITTYQGFRDYNEKFGVTIYDECRRLPAKTFSRLATISTEYRMGCDATPYREDGKNHLIVALTGFPQSINWQEYMRRYGPGYHAINVHIVKTRRAKLHKAKALYDRRKRTLFYSYHLDIGKELSRMLGLTFINASTDDRLDVMRNNHSFVASSVFAEGIHIEDLDMIIEIDFHFGSRQEEMQLTGRLMHSKQKRKTHHIIMTHDEFTRYRKRLLSLEGNGFHVRLLED